MSSHICVGIVTLVLATAFATPVSSADPAEWDSLIDDYITRSRSAKQPLRVGTREAGQRIETLFRSHRLSHVQIHIETNGKRSLSTELYYGQGELHVVQHDSGWNLVTKGAEAYEWKRGRQSGEIAVAETKELIAYTIYLTDPAMFVSYLHREYLKDPQKFEPPKPGESGCMELRLKERKNGFHALHLDEKRLWYGAFEYEVKGKGREPAKVLKWVFSKPKAIEKFPEAIFERLKDVKFRKSKNSLRRHRTYL